LSNQLDDNETKQPFFSPDVRKGIILAIIPSGIIAIFVYSLGFIPIPQRQSISEIYVVNISDFRDGEIPMYPDIMYHSSYLENFENMSIYELMQMYGDADAYFIWLQSKEMYMHHYV